jgi:hypothetical protein
MALIIPFSSQMDNKNLAPDILDHSSHAVHGLHCAAESIADTVLAADAVVVEPVSALQFADLQGDFHKMQGEPTQFLAESHCAVRNWKDFSLS